MFGDPPDHRSAVGVRRLLEFAGRGGKERNGHRREQNSARSGGQVGDLHDGHRASTRSETGYRPVVVGACPAGTRHISAPDLSN